MAYTRYKNKLNGIGIRIVETGEIFETRAQCANHLGVSPSMITMCLNGRVENCKGYHLEVVEMEFDHHLTPEILDKLYDLTCEDCEWREHPFRPDVYVSDTGSIAKNVRGRIILKEQHVQNSGYLTVSVADYRNVVSKNHNQLVHRLVAETFIPNPQNKPFVNHRDGNKFNNNAWNLEWCTHSENMRHAYDHGLYLTDRVMIEETGEIFDSASQCARVIGGTVSGLHDCKTGRQKKHRGYHFRFLGDGEDYFDVESRPPYLGLMVRDLWAGEEAYFTNIYEASNELGINRAKIVAALDFDSVCDDRYVFWYADREDRLLYGDEENKLLSWIRFGLR